MSVDPYYFGPRRPTKNGDTTSPYWPANVPWDPADAYASIGHLLEHNDFLVVAVASTELRALPKRLICSCTGDLCLLPILERVAAIRKIPRTDSMRAPPIVGKDAPWIWLVKAFPPENLDAESAAILHTDSVPTIDNEKLSEMWGVIDVSAFNRVLAHCVPDLLRAHALARVSVLQ